jgi:hypothetical protein
MVVGEQGQGYGQDNKDDEGEDPGQHDVDTVQESSEGKAD